MFGTPPKLLDGLVVGAAAGKQAVTFRYLLRGRPFRVVEFSMFNE